MQKMDLGSITDIEDGLGSIADAKDGFGEHIRYRGWIWGA